jgi:hypothetical protein
MVLRRALVRRSKSSKQQLAHATIIIRLQCSLHFLRIHNVCINMQGHLTNLPRRVIRRGHPYQPRVYCSVAGMTKSWLTPIFVSAMCNFVGARKWGILPVIGMRRNRRSVRRRLWRFHHVWIAKQTSSSLRVSSHVKRTSSKDTHFHTNLA